MTQYQPYEALFQAIARGKMFSPDLFHRLLRSGAILSRNLAQLLQVNFLPGMLTGQKQRAWGRSISFDAWIDVLAEARKLVSLAFLRSSVCQGSLQALSTDPFLLTGINSTV